MGKRLIISVLAFLLSLALSAQTTKIRGHVMDAATGKPVPFAMVYFPGTQTGTTSDENGEFSLTTRDTAPDEICVRLLGYATVNMKIRQGAFSDIMVMLTPQNDRLAAVTVRADDRKARRLLAGIDAHRSRNNPELRDAYRCDVYSRIELGLTQPRQLLRGKAVNRQWKFIFDYIDTSEVSGVEYLPMMLSESVASRSHLSNPAMDSERLTASRISGVQNADNLLGEFTGSLHLRNNFYSQFINVFNVEVPSPINSDGLLYYDYFIVDSLEMDARKTYVVHYHPRKFSGTPAFDGQMLVDAEDFALRSIKGTMGGGENINWVKAMQLEAGYRRLDDGTWFYESDRFYADFSIVPRDSTGIFTMTGNRLLEFSNPVFDRDSVEVSRSLVVGEAGSYEKDEAYWAQARPYPLSKRESDIYEMVDKVQDTPLYHTWYDVVSMVFNGFYDVGKIGFGPVLKTLSYNPLEGFRILGGIHTSPAWSKTDRLTAYIAYGFRDRQPKGGVKWEHLFSKQPTSKLTLDAHYDVLQLGRGVNEFNEGNLLSSIMGGGRSQKLSRVAEGSALYEHEFTPGVNTTWKALYRHFFSTPAVPLILKETGWDIMDMPTAHASATLRLSWEETVIRGAFINTPAGSRYPVLSIGLNGGSAFMAGRRHDYFRPEISLDWKGGIPPVGNMALHFDVGTIVGRVPYPLLHLHEGNGTYLMDKSSFSTMDYFEFASDTWTTLRVDHNFMGLLFSRIPWVKKFNLREAVMFKATWGCLSDRNNALSPDGQGLLLFPDGMHLMGSVPYIEAGFGITNIFRMFRVDFIWRCTHRDDPRPRPRNFVVNAGLEFRF